MLLSPLRAVFQIRCSQTLGAINPLPYPMTAINCVAWIVYGAAAEDPFLTPPNIIGLVAGMFFTLSVLPVCSRKMQDLIVGICLFASFVFGLLTIVSAFALSHSQHKAMWGAMCIAILCIYYLIPLSTMLHIIRAREASSIYLPLAITAMVNGAMWMIYGFAVSDMIIAGPNAIGVAVGIAQVLLRLWYGVNKRDVDQMRSGAASAVHGLTGGVADTKSEPGGTLTAAGAAQTMDGALTAPPHGRSAAASGGAVPVAHDDGGGNIRSGSSWAIGAGGGRPSGQTHASGVELLYMDGQQTAGRAWATSSVVSTSGDTGAAAAVVSTSGRWSGGAGVIGGVGEAAHLLALDDLDLDPHADYYKGTYKGYAPLGS
ncbi:hypothetical protein FOA52_015485 [Chlamydomonas sp. UWO 241]|nr:hypothetical protein FOA52_015485 [Chlamydomonas sp. UWO 241]